MPPFEDVEARGGGRPDLTGSEILVVNRASDGGELSYDRGDIAHVRPSGWPWGLLDDPETRRALHEGSAEPGVYRQSDAMTERGMSLEEAKDFYQRAADPPDKYAILRVSGRGFGKTRRLSRGQYREVERTLPHGETVVDSVTVSKSRFRVDLDNLPQATSRSLSERGKADLPEQALTSVTLDKARGGSSLESLDGLEAL